MLDESAIPANFTHAAKAVKKPAKSAEYLRSRSGRIVGVVASSAGRKLDRPATVGRDRGRAPAPRRRRGARQGEGPHGPRRAQARDERGREEGPGHEPARARGRPGSRSASATTSARTSGVPAQLIDGTVLRPGQSFDWWDAIWPVTPARGFGPGGFIASDHTEPTGALGGGMCSSSTTLFNAAMRAGPADGRPLESQVLHQPLSARPRCHRLDHGRRPPDDDVHQRHARPRSSSAASGSGRAASAGSATRSGASRTAGPSASPARASRTSARRRRTVNVDTLPTGVKRAVEYPSNGMTTSVTRVVRDAKGRVIHNDTLVSHYVLWNGIINVGR